MEKQPKRWIPLFPLQLVLLPMERLPLHIFEPRYRLMLKRCEEESTAFGVVLVREGKLAAVGCEARVQKVLQNYPDGRSDVLVRGGMRFRTSEFRQHSDGYIEGKTRPLGDHQEVLDTEMARALFRLLEQFQTVQKQGAEDLSLSGQRETKTLSHEVRPDYTFRVGARCPLSVEERQKILEMRSESRREQFLVRHLVKAIPRLRQAQEDQVRVKGNGRARGGLH